MKVIILAILASTLFMSIGVNAMDGKWKCEPLTTVLCGAEGCTNYELMGWIYVEFDTNTYSACDAKTPCRVYKMKTEPSGYGNMVNAHVNNVEPYLFRMTPDGKAYVEVISMGTYTLQNFGSCKQL